MVKKEVSKPVVDAAKKTETVREAAKVETKAATVKKAAEKKETPAKKPAAKRTSTRRAAVKETVYVQYAGRELDTAKLVAAAKKDYVKKTGAKAADIKTVELYVKPEENVAYYVVNGKGEGDYKLDL